MSLSPAAQAWAQQQDHFRAHRVRLFLEHGAAGLYDVEYLQHDASRLHVLRERHWWWRRTTGALRLCPCCAPREMLSGGRR